MIYRLSFDHFLVHLFHSHLNEIYAVSLTSDGPWKFTDFVSTDNYASGVFMDHFSTELFSP